jgi:hypothetical protein
VKILYALTAGLMLMCLAMNVVMAARASQRDDWRLVATSLFGVWLTTSMSIWWIYRLCGGPLQ